MTADECCVTEYIKASTSSVSAHPAQCVVCHVYRVKNDNSIVCNPRLPSCYKAELVSPVLRGVDGLYSVYDVLKAIKRFSPSVNKSTGMHVHVSDEQYATAVSADWLGCVERRVAQGFG